MSNSLQVFGAFLWMSLTSDEERKRQEAIAAIRQKEMQEHLEYMEGERKKELEAQARQRQREVREQLEQREEQAKAEDVARKAAEYRAAPQLSAEEKARVDAELVEVLTNPEKAEGLSPTAKAENWRMAEGAYRMAVEQDRPKEELDLLNTGRAEAAGLVDRDPQAREQLRGRELDRLQRHLADLERQRDRDKGDDLGR